MKRVEQNFLRLWLKRLQAMLCLISLLAGQTGVFAALLATASALEASHTPYASMSQSGFIIVLSHERGQPGRPDFLARHQPTNPAHHHGLTAGVLCALGGSTQPLADHAACFSRGGPAESLGHKLRLASERPAAETIAVRSPQISSFVSVRCPPLRCSHAHVGLPQALQEMRTTLLLI